MKRGLFVFFVVSLLAYSVVPAFAEESGSAIGTFGFGLTYYGDTYYFGGTSTAICFNLDLVSKIGLTGSFGYMTNFKINAGTDYLAYIGLGYRYLADKWDIGLSVVAIPFVPYDFLVGIKANGGYWFTKDLGATLTIMFEDDIMGYSTSAFRIWLGMSVRL